MPLHTGLRTEIHAISVLLFMIKAHVRNNILDLVKSYKFSVSFRNTFIVQAVAVIYYPITKVTIEDWKQN